MKYFYIVSYLLLCSCSDPDIKIEKFDFYKFCNDVSNRNNLEFFKIFPFEEYLKTNNILHLNVVNEHRLFLQKRRGIGDDFLCRLAEYCVYKRTPEPLQHNLESIFEIGETFLKGNTGIDEKDRGMFQVIGYYILRCVSEHLVANKSNFTEKSFALLKQRLADHNVYLHVKQNTMGKIWGASPGYLLKRFTNKYIDSDQVGNLFLAPRAMGPKSPPRKGVLMFDLIDKGNPVGISIWMERAHLHAFYYTKGNILHQLGELHRKNDVVLETSGGFTNIDHEPEGFTMQNGEMVNSVMLPDGDRDGLVVIENNGGIRVCNLLDPFLLPGETGYIQPRKHLADYQRLIAWLKARKASAFQTHLLVYSDLLLIDPEKAQKEKRERRLLVLATDNRTHQTHHVIFYVHKAKELANVAIEIYRLMEKRNKKIEAILNLDVGQNDILRVFDGSGKQIPDAQGAVAIHRAENLLIYTHVK